MLEKVKKELISAPKLHTVDFKNELHIFCDASDTTCAAVIFQKRDSKFFLVACFSKKLPPAIQNKDIYIKELYAFQQVAKSYRYLYIGDHSKIFWVDKEGGIHFNF